MKLWVGNCIRNTGFMKRKFKRPKIGLVLGGGGPRGLAHIGVLKVLEKMVCLLIAWPEPVWDLRSGPCMPLVWK